MFTAELSKNNSNRFSYENYVFEYTLLNS